MNKFYGDKEGKKKVDNIRISLQEIYNEYRLRFGGMDVSVYSCESGVGCFYSGSSSGTSLSECTRFVKETFELASGLSELNEFLANISANQSFKCDLDMYLDEGVHPIVERFDILGWWKMNALKYPLVSRMTRDFLAIPVSTVASESAFSTDARVIDPSRSFMHANIVEALICSQDWIRKTFSEHG